LEAFDFFLYKWFFLVGGILHGREQAIYFLFNVVDVD